MNLWFLFELAISSLEAIVRRTRGKLDDQVVASVRRALTELKKVRGLPVTKQQLESLRTRPRW